MNRRTALTLMTMGLLSLTVALPAGNAVAQQGRVSYEVSAKDTTYTKQQNIDVDDRHPITSCEFTSFVASSRATRPSSTA